jgi:hypothetical protein
MNDEDIDFNDGAISIQTGHHPADKLNRIDSSKYSIDLTTPALHHFEPSPFKEKAAQRAPEYEHEIRSESAESIVRLNENELHLPEVTKTIQSCRYFLTTLHNSDQFSTHKKAIVQIQLAEDA